MDIMWSLVILLVIFVTGVQSTCLGLSSDLDQTKIATMCKASVVSGTQVFIDTDLATNTTLSTGIVCSCDVTAQGGRQVTINSFFGGFDNTNCGTSAEFTHASFNYILGTPCYDHNFAIPTNMSSYKDITVSLRKNNPPAIATYCVAMTLVTSQCTDGQFECNDGQCISSSLRCNGFPDCNDDSDERSCSSTTCSEGFKKCEGTDQCLDPTKWCDGTYDCADRSDESAKNCDPNYVTTSGTGTGTTQGPIVGTPQITVSCRESSFLITSTTTISTSTTTTTPTTTTPTTTTTTPTTTTPTTTTPTTTTSTTPTTTTSTTTTSTTTTPTTTTSTTTTSTPTTPTTTTSTTTTPTTTTSTTTTSTTTTPTTTTSTTTTPTTTTRTTSTSTMPTTTTSSSTTSTTPSKSPSTLSSTSSSTTSTLKSSLTTSTASTPMPTKSSSTTPSSKPTIKTTRERDPRTTPAGSVIDDDDEDDKDIIIIVIVVGVLALLLLFLAIIYCVRTSKWYRGENSQTLSLPKHEGSTNSYSNGAFDAPDLKELPDVYPQNTPTHKWVPVEESAYKPGVVHIKYGPENDYVFH